MTSMRRTLLVFMLAALLAVLLLSGAIVFGIARRGLRAQLDDDLNARARTFASMVIDETGELEFDYLGPLDEPTLGVWLRITGDRGVVLAESPECPSSLQYGAILPSARSSPDFGSLEIGPGSPVRAATLALPATRDPDEAPFKSGGSDRIVRIEVFARTDAVARAERSVLMALLAGGLLAAVGVALAVALGAARGLRPLAQLRAELDTIDAGEPDWSGTPGTYPQELRPVVGAVDALLARLRGAMDRERRFTDAAAHELRTPIAELRTLTDVARKWPDEHRSARSLEEAGQIADEMESLIESLLASARGGKAFAQQPAEPVELLPLARQLFERELDRRGGAELDIAFTGDEHTAWTAPRGAVVAIVANLVRNAVEYTPPDGSVRVAVTGGPRPASAPAPAAFEITNGPVELNADQVEHLFEPFWRADHARTEPGGRGLGLAIVASLCARLEIEREAGLVEDGRLRVRLNNGV